MPRAVLIIVDLLNDFFERSPVLTSQRDRLVAAANQLVGEFRSAALPVFWVRQEFAADLHDAFPEMRAKNLAVTIAGTPGCQLLPELDWVAGDSIVVKKRYSAFFGTDLEGRLSELQPQYLVVAGVNTHACVRMTVLDAYQRDYDVLVAADCIASHDLEHHDVTVRYLSGKIARVVSNAEILALIGSGPGQAGVE